MTGIDLDAHPVHLGMGASAIVQPRFSGTMDWYSDYAERHLADGVEGRLVSMHTFTASWDMWEMHPHGSELVLCTAGAVTLIQEAPAGAPTRVILESGQFAINPPGVWHTADVETQATVVFITAGLGTQHRAR